MTAGTQTWRAALAATVLIATFARPIMQVYGNAFRAREWCCCAGVYGDSGSV
jgi:hypothetical protein